MAFAGPLTALIGLFIAMTKRFTATTAMPAVEHKTLLSIPGMSLLYRRVLPLLLCLSTIPFTALAADSPNAHPPANPKVRAILADLGKVQAVGETSLSPDGRPLAWTQHDHGSPSRIVVSDARGQ